LLKSGAAACSACAAAGERSISNASKKEQEKSSDASK
jgi:hypothetical protein